MSKRLQRLITSICMILVLLTSMLFAACAKEAAPATTSPVTTAPAVTTPKPTTPAVTTPAPTTPKTTTPAPAPAAQVYNWKLAGGWPPGGAIHKYLMTNLVECIERATSGRIKLTLFGGGVLYPVAEAYDATSQGATELCATAASYFRGKVPIFGVDEGMPFMYPDDVDWMYVHYQLGVGELKRKELMKYNVYWIGVTPGSGEGHGLMSVNPVRKLEDFKNVTVRSFGAYLDWYQMLGAKTVFIPHDEVYMALKLGTINAYSTGRGEQWDWRGHEVCKYYYTPGVGAQAGQVFANMAAWNKLPAELQRLVELAVELHAGYAAYAFGPVWADQATRWFDGYGLQRIDWDAETVKVMREKAVELWKKNAAGNAQMEEVLKIIIDYLDKRAIGKLPVGPEYFMKYAK